MEIYYYQLSWKGRYFISSYRSFTILNINLEKQKPLTAAIFF